MKKIFAALAAVVLGGLILTGYHHYQRKHEARWDTVLELSRRSITISARLCLMDPTRERIVTFRDSVKRQRLLLARKIGSEERRIRVRCETERMLDSIVSYLETKGAETEELMELLEEL